MSPRQAPASLVGVLHANFSQISNDHQIVLRDLLPRLQALRDQGLALGAQGRRSFRIKRSGPRERTSRSGMSVARMYERFIEHELWQAFLVYSVSRFEGFLFQILRLVLTLYPERLLLAVPEAPVVKRKVLAKARSSGNPDRMLEEIIDNQLDRVFRLTPERYLSYLSTVTGVQLPEGLRNAYIEVKATRDVVVHGSGVATPTYVRKAGKDARCRISETLVIDQPYFEASLAVLNDLSRLLARNFQRSIRRSRAVAGKPRAAPADGVATAPKLPPL